MKMVVRFSLLLSVLLGASRTATAQSVCDFISCAPLFYCVDTPTARGCVCSCPHGYYCYSEDFVNFACEPGIVPTSVYSIVPASFPASPDGAIALTIELRDQTNAPVADYPIGLYYGPYPGYQECASFSVCPGSAPDDYVLDVTNKRILGMTNSSGYATFHLRAGGGCSDALVWVNGEGVGRPSLGARSIASTDQNGDLLVNETDVEMLQSKVGGTDPTGDLNADGAVDSNDLAVQQASLGQVCLSTTRSQRTSWGQVKVKYR